MRRRSRIAAVLTTVALMVGTALPAMAQSPAHRSCQGFGHLFADFAQNFDAGAIISHNARNEVEAFGQTFTPPGSIAAIVHVEQELFCESR